jgi:hypothetical protein
MKTFDIITFVIIFGAGIFNLVNIIRWYKKEKDLSKQKTLKVIGIVLGISLIAMGIMRILNRYY